MSAKWSDGRAEGEGEDTVVRKTERWLSQKTEQNGRSWDSDRWGECGTQLPRLK
jgi:hypothetical protein